MKKIKCGILHPDEETGKRFCHFIEQTPFLKLTAQSTSPSEMLPVCQQKEIELLLRYRMGVIIFVHIALFHMQKEE